MWTFSVWTTVSTKQTIPKCRLGATGTEEEHLSYFLTFLKRADKSVVLNPGRRVPQHCTFSTSPWDQPAKSRVFKRWCVPDPDWLNNLNQNCSPGLDDKLNARYNRTRAAEVYSRPQLLPGSLWRRTPWRPRSRIRLTPFPSRNWLLWKTATSARSDRMKLHINISEYGCGVCLYPQSFNS